MYEKRGGGGKEPLEGRKGGGGGEEEGSSEERVGILHKRSTVNKLENQTQDWWHCRVAGLGIKHTAASHQSDVLMLCP